MKIKDLPAEILSLILRFLPQPCLFECTVVDQRFHSAAIPLLWRAPELIWNTQFQRFMCCLANSRKPLGHWVRRFSVNVTLSLTDEECLHVIKCTPQLEALIVEDSEFLTDKSISRLSDYCSELQELHLERADITYRSAHHLGRCKQLRKLTLRECPRLLPMTLLPLAACPLESLDLSGCKWLNVEDTAYDLRAFRRLRHLDLVCSDRYDPNRFLRTLSTDDDGSVALPDLVSFALTGRNEVDDASVIQFVELHPKLEDLTLMACAITDKSLKAICQLPNLLFLDISFCEGVTAEGVRKLLRNTECLMMLGLKGCGILKSDFPELQSSRQQLWLAGPMVDRFGRDDILLIRTYSDTSTNPDHVEDGQMSPIPSQIRSAPVFINVDESIDLHTIETYAAIQQSLRDVNIL